MRKGKSTGKRLGLILGIAPVLMILGVLGWYVAGVFEGEAPRVAVEPLPEYLGGALSFKVRAEDTGRGLRTVKATLSQEGREIDIFEQRFPFTGLRNTEGAFLFQREFPVNPAERGLAQGRVDLTVRVWDYSRRRGGDGNLSIFQHKMMVDTIPPALRPISRMHYVNEGGSGLVVYQTSSDTVESGLRVDDLLFKGYPAGQEAEEGAMVCYFALPVGVAAQPKVRLWARDRAGNESTGSLYFHMKKRSFKTDKVLLTDRLLENLLSYFSFYDMGSAATLEEKFLKINRDLRAEGARIFQSLTDKTPKERLWEGPWMRQKNSATMATFGDRRFYYYQGKEIDRQTHMGVDLASLANSPVEACNRGRVVFADRLGIYGMTVVLDHGQGLASVYAHLSHIQVSPGQTIDRGEVIGRTGQTGLAGGDHLHFSVLVGGVFVNPVEWWDPHWVRDNVEKKLALLKR